MFLLSCGDQRWSELARGPAGTLDASPSASLESPNMAEFTLRHLKYFVAVADEESVTGAAKKLHVSPGGVSLAISELESVLGIQLTLRRRAKGVALTPAGRRSADLARSILRESGELQEIARAMRGEIVGTLRIGCFSTLSPWLMPRIIAHFIAEHPGVRVEMVEESSDVLQRQLLDGDLDVCLMYRNHIRPGMEWEEIVAVRLQLLLAADHPLAGRSEVALDELKDEPAVLLSLRPASEVGMKILKEAGLEDNVRWLSSNVETIRSMVAHGVGYSVLMGRPAGDTTYDGLPVVYKPIRGEIPANAVVLAYPDGNSPNAKIRALSAFCRHEFSEERHPVQ